MKIMEIYKTSCQNCLLSNDSIVSPARRKEIIKGCVQNQTHFICHKTSMEGKDICCKTFYDKLGQHSQLIRIMERLNAIKFVEQPESEKLLTYSEMKNI